MGATGQGVSHLCAHHGRLWVLWDQPSPRGDLGGDIHAHALDPSLLLLGLLGHFPTALGGFSVASWPRLPVEDALLGG